MNDNIALLEKAHAGSAESESELVKNNMGLVRSVAVRFLYSGLDYDDICQIGSLGLLKAIRNFDFSRGVMFSTYAVPVIIGEIRKFLRDDGPVKISRGIREQYIKLRRAREQFEKENERCPTASELSSLTDIPYEDVLTALSAGSTPVSLDEEVGDDCDTVLSDMISCTDPVNGIEMIALKEGINALEAQERQIIVLRYFCSKTQQEVAAELGLTQVQVSRKEKKILERLKMSMT